MAPIGKWTTLALVATVAVVQAADFKIVGSQAQLNGNRIATGEATQLIVTVGVEGDANAIPKPEVAISTQLTLAGPKRFSSTSTEINMINGKFAHRNTTQVQFVYEITATKPGTFTVGPIRYQGRDLGQAQIIVRDGTAERKAVAAQAAQDIRTSTLVGQKNLYVGQQLPFTWRLTAGRPFEIRNFPDVRSALGKGFYTVTPDNPTTTMQVVTENGKQVGRFDITGSLFPLRTGKQVLPTTALDYRMTVATPGTAMDPFEAMMRGEDPFEAMRQRQQVVNGTAKTQEVPLQILPVPEAGKPSSFQGGVGQFTLSAQLENKPVRVGDGLNLTLTLEGNGQPQASGFPLWKAPDSLEAYPPEDTWTRQWRNGQLYTKLVRRIVLVPRAVGIWQLDSARFAYFDPTKRQFVTLAAQTGTVVVSAAKASPQVASSEASVKGQILSRQDRAWIWFGKLSAAIWALLVLGLAGWGLFHFLRHRLDRKARRKRKLQSIQNRLRTIPSDPRKAATVLRTTIVDGFCLLYGDELRSWSARETKDRLPAITGWNSEDAQNLGQFLYDLEASEFGGFPLPEHALQTTSALFTRLTQQV